jgi:hypothetical protein
VKQVSTIDETIQSLQRDLSDAEADIQAALYSMKTRVTDIKIVTHQRRDRATPEGGRPGFFREELGLIKHLEAVQTRADMEHTTTSLNHKNWGSVVNALMEVSSGCVEDGNKIALRVDSIKNALRTMHLLQQHLAATSKALPAIPEPTPGPQPAAPPMPTPPPVPTAAPAFNIGTTTTVSAAPPLEYSLADIHFADENDLAAEESGPEPDQPDEPDRSMSEELDEEDENADD